MMVCCWRSINSTLVVAFNFRRPLGGRIRKEIVREALLYLTSVSRSYDAKLPRDVSLDCHSRQG